jgi:flavodoxin
MKNKKILVAFFSHTGENFFPGGLRYIEKGNTHIAAEIIAELTDADLFEIKSAAGYSEVYKECVMQAKAEFDSDARPTLAEDIDISAYDVIFLGYPNWCGTMPMPVWTFLENHDFGGKIVCPFCTNEGSGLANSIAHIDKLVPTADRKDGLAIKGSQVMESREILKNWIDGICSF